MTHTTSPIHPAVRLHGPRRTIGFVLFVLLLVFTSLSLLFTALITKLVLDDLGEYAQLTKHGERIEAVISARRAGEDESGATYYLSYRFEAGNQPFEQETKVYEYEYTRYQEGMTLTVVYLPDDPKTSMPDMVLIRETRVVRVMLVVIPLGFVGVPGLLFVVWWWIFRRTAARLRKRGVTATATITDVRREGRDDPQIFTFEFNAKHPNGTIELIGGQEWLTTNIVEFTPGDTIRVRYLATKPEVFMIETESLVEAVKG